MFLILASKEWHRVVKDKTILCSNCCATYKKFNDKELIELVVEPPSYMFKPVNSAKAQMNGDGKHSLHNVLSTQVRSLWCATLVGLRRIPVIMCAVIFLYVSQFQYLLS